MSKINNPLKSNVLASLDELEANERVALEISTEKTGGKSNSETKNSKTTNKTNTTQSSANKNHREIDNRQSLDNLDLDDENEDRESFVTRNYSFLSSVDTDIDRLRMALKKRGRKYTKQELVNTLLRERLQQLEDKGIF